MVSSLTVLFVIVSLCISLFLPMALLAAFAARNRKQGIVSAWLLGAAGFFVTQILIRVPILTALQGQEWFSAFAQKHLFLYAFLLAFTAGLFELAGRFAVAKLLSKNLTYRRSLAAGLGHGGIEAMVLVGVTYVNNLIYITLINSGGFDALLAQTAAMGVDVSGLEQIRQQLVDTSPVLFLLGGFERLLAMTAHAGMSMLVCWGVYRKKVLPCLLTALGIHTFLDLTAGIFQILAQSAAYAYPTVFSYIPVYAILIAAAGLSLWILKDIHRRWQDKEVTHDSP